ncbi:class II lanthipeptide, LchA2/BrtA2 family [Inconstantimicrobium mannanitabidum]|uniref:Uncharacterized protein n=1 Tax=Inconstantimicrobium mannanitabidum TaxID=1604901 RepID=A0ACB5RIM0_9CLOT|nr:class II lanthipeptide, LchA2/BrtA2 family [Clostridium sp. TW13]GKX68940.1 hypothetical protein rsdtw13_41980 [Clostridium sp. TW13]
MKEVDKAIKEDPAGLVEIDELTELTVDQKVNGAIGTTAVTVTIGISEAVCPTRNQGCTVGTYKCR